MLMSSCISLELLRDEFDDWKRAGLGDMACSMQGSIGNHMEGAPLAIGRRSSSGGVLLRQQRKVLGASMNQSAGREME
jgi:hypothetical protein